ncbi:MAG: hypothetical protein Q4C00_04750 [Bacillota bacterium]|nr:hypothetical protein [Bacillota bacterium]
MASIKKILADSFEDVKENIKPVHEINKENLELVKAINRANLEEARKLSHDISAALTEEDNDGGTKKSID